MINEVVFRGIEGSNPLAFLAAAGTARLCHLAWPEHKIRLRWFRDSGWLPRISGLPIGDPQKFCLALQDRAPWSPLEPFREMGQNLTVPPVIFSKVVQSTGNASGEDRRAADFVSAFGCEILREEKRDRIQITDLCFITGSGHQDFLGTARGLANSCRPQHLQEALFGPWRYADPGFSMRWDPDDAKEYALRWRDPSVGGVNSVWGANRLAFEALPLFPAVPTETGLRTTGFHTRNRVHEFTWPIWTQSVSIETMRSLFSLPDLQEENPDRTRLHEMGIEEIFRVQRVRIGQGANFKVSFRPARAV